MKMRKILALGMASAMAVSLAACGSSSSTSSTSSTAESSTTTESSTASESSTSGSSTAGTVTIDPNDGTYNLVFTNHDATTSVGEQFCETFLNQIADASDGHITVEYNAGGSLYGGGEAVDQVENGGADLCWNATSITTGRFLVSEYISVPLNGITCAQMASKVARDMYDQLPEMQEEYSDFKVVELQGNCAAPLSTREVKIETPDDLQGVTIRAAGTVQSQYINDLGAAAQSMSTADVYEALSKGVVQGMTNDWHNIDCFKLYEVIDYCMDTTINNTCCFILMNKDVYDSMEEDLQQLIDSYYAYGSDMAAYYWDSMRVTTGAEMEENNVEIYTPSDEVKAYMESDEEAQAMRDWYVNYLTENGYDNAEDIVSTCESIVAQYADEYADPYSEENAVTIEDFTATPADYQ